MPAASLRALLAGSFDYAGLFPPADLPLRTALQNYADYVRAPDAWMLGAFVLPLAKFEDASENLGLFDVEHRLRISALGAKSEQAPEFTEAFRAGTESIEAFVARHGAVAAVDQVEFALPVHPGVTAAEIADSGSSLRVPIFLEGTTDEAERVIHSLANHNERRVGVPLGFKLRTGGVIASAFPSSIQIARALVAAASNRVPIKFTAGLHHPVRCFHNSVQTMMHGFLNVLGAGILAAEHNWDMQQTAAMLDDEEASAFGFTEELFQWGEWKISTDQIAARRKLVTSIGSCSFDEPRDDLRALGLLP